MERLIDADALITEIEETPLTMSMFANSRDCYTALTTKSMILGIVKDAPTISHDDVRGVVHCGECKFWRRPPSCEGLARCETGETGIRYRSKNDFCSRGAKMEVSEDA